MRPGQKPTVQHIADELRDRLRQKRNDVRDKLVELSGNIGNVESNLEIVYLSPSRFSREYGRFFGCPPTADISKLRETMAAGEVE